MTTRLDVVQNIPFRWSWLLYDNVLTNDAFDGLVNFDAYFVARTSPASRFSKVLLERNSTMANPEITKFEPNRIDLWLLPASTILLFTGYYEVTIKHKTNSSLDFQVASGPLHVARRGVAVPVVAP